MTNQNDDKDDDFSTNVVEPDENEWRKYIDEFVETSYSVSVRQNPSLLEWNIPLLWNTFFKMHPSARKTPRKK